MGMLMEFKATCPVDGTTFTYMSTPSYSVFGRALDGLPHGSWIFPLRLPQCPACRFPATFRDLEPAERTRAQALIASEAWTEAGEETPYWRLNLAEVALGRATGWTRIDRLLQATWECYGDPARYGRYAAQLGQAMDEIAADLKPEKAEACVVHQVFVANVERQAGDFKRAAARLDQIDAARAVDAGMDERIALTRGLIANGSRRQQFPDR
ncbi:hypothetical protein [Brevundimonas aveniformis]|uniref:hypothetical protein n=1 Tax=Brevundimonas aveniformis TaxID=370977 RepID=UPI00249344D9|nr:hypothetical protein [Brevundimonas aveniformis]